MCSVLCNLENNFRIHYGSETQSYELLEQHLNEQNEQ